MDREPSEWLQENDRVNSLRSEILQSLGLLEYSGCLDKVIIWWVRREVLKELDLIDIDSKLKNLSMAERLTHWAKLEWGHRMNEIFLEKKDSLDVISFNILRVSNHAVALELYHRLKENESSFPSLSQKFAITSEKDRNPFKKNVRLGSLPIGLQDIIRSLQVGRLTKPLQFKNQFVLIRLEEFQGAEMSDEVQNKLALDQFNVWASSIAELARDRLM